MNSGLQKSIDGHYIRMKWPYFQSLKNLRNTARKALRLFWLNAKHSEVSLKMVSHVLLARLDPAKTCLKVTKNLLFSAKMACFQSFLMKKSKFCNFETILCRV